jgi:hypothetical protein
MSIVLLQLEELLAEGAYLHALMGGQVGDLVVQVLDGLFLRLNQLVVLFYQFQLLDRFILDYYFLLVVLGGDLLR